MDNQEDNSKYKRMEVLQENQFQKLLEAHQSFILIRTANFSFKT